MPESIRASQRLGEREIGHADTQCQHSMTCGSNSNRKSNGAVCWGLPCFCQVDTHMAFSSVTCPAVPLLPGGSGCSCICCVLVSWGRRLQAVLRHCGEVEGFECVSTLARYSLC